MNDRRFEKVKKSVRAVTSGTVLESMSEQAAIIMRLDLAFTDQGPGVNIGLVEEANLILPKMLGEKTWDAWVEAAMTAIARDEVLKAVMLDLELLLHEAESRRE